MFWFLENIDSKEGYYEGLISTFGKNTLKRLEETNEHWRKLEEIHQKNLKKEK